MIVQRTEDGGDLIVNLVVGHFLKLVSNFHVTHRLPLAPTRNVLAMQRPIDNWVRFTGEGHLASVESF